MRRKPASKSTSVDRARRDPRQDGDAVRRRRSFDIFNLDYNWIPEFAGGGHLLRWTICSAPKTRADFFPLALKVASYDGKLYGVPQTVHPHLSGIARTSTAMPRPEAASRRPRARSRPAQDDGRMAGAVEIPQRTHVMAARRCRLGGSGRQRIRQCPHLVLVLFTYGGKRSTTTLPNRPSSTPEGSLARTMGRDDEIHAARRQRLHLR